MINIGKRLTLGTLLLLSFAGCGKKESGNADALQKVTLQLDWYAEPAHGGFYEALLKGFYEEEGLALEIVQGGSGTVPLQAVTVGSADFALSRVDDVLMGIDRGLPLLLTMAYMQKDPQAIMFHASNPIESWEDLNGKAVMVDPGGAFVAWLKEFHDISFDILPVDYGIQRFLADPNFIQQCFVTSQPYYAKQQGVEVGTLLLSDSGYKPERVVMTNRSLATRKPELVAAFVRASIRGWESYMASIPTDTHAYLIELNSANNEGLNSYSHNAMTEYRVVEGSPEDGESIGLIEPEKLKSTISTLHTLNLIEKDIPLERVINYSILPDQVRTFTR